MTIKEHSEVTIAVVSLRSAECTFKLYLITQETAEVTQHSKAIKNQMNNQESATTFERIIKKLQPMKERNRTNRQSHQSKVTGGHPWMNVLLQTQTFRNNLAKHRWIAFLKRKKKSLSPVYLFPKCI